MAELLLTHSYLLNFDPKQEKTGQPFAPLGTLYAASVLKQSGVDVSFYDPMFSQSPDQILKRLRQEKPSILVIYDDGFNYLTKMCLSNMRASAFRMIELGQELFLKIIVYSSDAIDNYARYLEKGVDFVILGEGESTLIELVNSLLNKSEIDFSDIKGIAWKKEGQVKVNATRGLITSLDTLPFPAWELIDIEKYRNAWKRRNGYFTMNMVSSRGCPYHCIWCAKPMFGNHYNSRSPENVIEEMIFLLKNFSPDRIWFTDDIFGLKPGWIETFARLIKLHGINLPYTIQSRVDLLLTNNHIASLADSGCKKVWMGIESGSQKILDSMQKGILVEQIYAVSPVVRKAGIEQAFFLQLGFPSETMEDITKTIKLLTDLMPDEIGISVTYPLPGTSFYETVRKELESKTNWKDSDDLHPLVGSTYSQGFYKPLHRYIHKYYRYKQSLFFVRLLIHNPLEIKLMHIKRMILMPYFYVFSLFYKMILIKEKNASK